MLTLLQQRNAQAFKAAASAFVQVRDACRPQVVQQPHHHHRPPVPDPPLDRRQVITARSRSVSPEDEADYYVADRGGVVWSSAEEEDADQQPQRHHVQPRLQRIEPVESRAVSFADEDKHPQQPEEGWQEKRHLPRFVSGAASSAARPQPQVPASVNANLVAAKQVLQLGLSLHAAPDLRPSARVNMLVQLINSLAYGLERQWVTVRIHSNWQLVVRHGEGDGVHYGRGHQSRTGFLSKPSNQDLRVEVIKVLQQLGINVEEALQRRHRSAAAAAARPAPSSRLQLGRVLRLSGMEAAEASTVLFHSAQLEVPAVAASRPVPSQHRQAQGSAVTLRVDRPTLTVRWSPAIAGCFIKLLVPVRPDLALDDQVIHVAVEVEWSTP